MFHKKIIIYRCFLVIAFALLLSIRLGATGVPPSSLILSLGASRISMKPAIDSAINGFKLPKPGVYVKLSGESYFNARDFIHVDLNMSINKGVMDNGYLKESRLCFNYGFGRSFKLVKVSISPGLCYSSVGYENTRTKKSIVETRFAPSLGVQTDLIILSSPYRYLGIFIEGSVMFAKPSRWVHQLAIGIAWKPSFRKPEKDIYLPQ
ncbi:MAG: hypothetical protein PSX81_08825 [bacterium]|nr:hypothetical protein [bacterium]